MHFSIKSTEDGIVNCYSKEQIENADFLIDFKHDGINISWKNRKFDDLINFSPIS